MISRKRFPFLKKDEFKYLEEKQLLNIPKLLEKSNSDGERNEVLDSIKKKILVMCVSPVFRLDTLLLYDGGCIITTGSRSIDSLLGEGINEGEIVEIYGRSSSGKTQLCLTSSLHFASSNQGTVLYIDSSNSFDLKRLELMYNELKKDPSWNVQDSNWTSGNKRLNLEASLKKIRHTKVFEISELDQIFENIIKSKKTGRDYYYVTLKIIIIDSIASLIAPINGTSVKECKFLNFILMESIFRKMRYIAEEYNIAFIISNYSLKDLSAALGYRWNSLQSVSLKLNYSSTSNEAVVRIASLEKGVSCCDYCAVEFLIDDRGVADSIFHDDSDDEVEEEGESSNEMDTRE